MSGGDSFITPPVNPDEQAFVDFADKAGLPVTPLIFQAANDGVLAWSAFAELERRHPYAFLLESAETGENGRYSVMGAAPQRLFVFQNGVFTVRDGEGKTLSESPCDSPISALAAHLQELSVPPMSPELPPLLGGVVGYMGYDCAHYFEPVGKMPPDLLNIPDMLWMQTDVLAVFDHFRHNVYVIKNCLATTAAAQGWRSVYQEGRRQAEELLADFSRARTPPLRLTMTAAAKLEIQSNYSKEEFCATVESFKKYIQAGDIFQGVPSQRLSFDQPASTLDIYRCLRRMNPSPYMFYLKCDDFVAAGSSPELMVSCQKNRLRLRPIAGTRPRGGNPQEDAALEAELLADEKERAEHLMLVDLGRNDVGRVAAAGTVQVTNFFHVERYSHVMHIVSDVKGQLADGMTAFDALRAAFPAGTLSGAPKVRAMQLINDTEPCKRNLYGGCAGYVSFDGDMMTCIAIRSFTAKGGRCHVQAGGGIVADSIPAAEYQESLNKAAAVLRAAEMAAQEKENGDAAAD